MVASFPLVTFCHIFKLVIVSGSGRKSVQTFLVALLCFVKAYLWKCYLVHSCVILMS